MFARFFSCTQTIVFSLLLAGCQAPSLSVFKEHVSIESLPSYKIGTPDPALADPEMGEKLHISWRLAGEGPGYLRLSLKYNEGSFDEIEVPLEKTSGVYVYPLLNGDYCETKGILTYRVELYEGECLVKTWQHQLWVDPLPVEN